MTKKEAIEESLKMWRAIYNGWPECSKADYLRTWNKDRTQWPRAMCFICEFVMGEFVMDKDYEGECLGKCPGKCIIDWGSDAPYSCEDCLTSPYRRWIGETDLDVCNARDDARRIVKLHEEALEREDANV